MTVLNEGTYARILDSYRSMAYAASGKTCNGKPCEHLNCDEASSAACTVACGQGLIDSFNKNCVNKPLAPFSTSFGGGPKNVKPSTKPNPDPDADCNSFGFFKPLCVAGKSITKGGQSVAGSFGNLGSFFGKNGTLIVVAIAAVAGYFIIKKL